MKVSNIGSQVLGFSGIQNQNFKTQSNFQSNLAVKDTVKLSSKKVGFSGIEEIVGKKIASGVMDTLSGAVKVTVHKVKGSEHLSRVICQDGKPVITYSGYHAIPEEEGAWECLTGAGKGQIMILQKRLLSAGNMDEKRGFFYKSLPKIEEGKQRFKEFCDQAYL